MDLIRGIEAKPRQTAGQEGKVKKGMTEYWQSTCRSWTKSGQESKTDKNSLFPWKFTTHSKYFISTLTSNITCSYVRAQI